MAKGTTKERRCLKSCTRYIWWYSDQLVTILTPLLLLPIPLLIPGQEALCGYIFLVMGTYWVTTCVPIYFTGMIPVFTFTLMGILTPSQVAAQYLTDSMMTMVGAAAAAMSFERTGLHRRIALAVLNLVSPRPEWLMIGMTIPSWFLSMWIVNTATLTMMLTISEAMLHQMKELRQIHANLDRTEEVFKKEITEKDFDNPAFEKDGVAESKTCNGNLEMIDVIQLKTSSTAEEFCATSLEPRSDRVTSFQVDQKDPDTESYNTTTPTEEKKKVVAKQQRETTQRESEEDEFIKCFGIALSLAVCFAAKIGGMATVTGSVSNLVVKDYIDMYYADRGHGSPITYTNWMAMCTPLSLLTVILCDMWLQLFHIGPRSFLGCFKRKKLDTFENSMKIYLRGEYKALGRITYPEIVAATLFSILVLLWFFRDPGFMPGWASFFPAGYTSDSIPCIFITFLMFFIPMNPPWQKMEPGTKNPDTLLIWSCVHQKMPWGAFLLIGGGGALGEAAVQSGLADWIASLIDWLEYVPHVLLVFILILVAGLLTECLMPTTICALFINPVGQISEKLGKSPLYLQWAVGVGTFLAFMLPSSSVTSAMVFSSGRVNIMDMVKSGFAVNIIACFTGTLAITTWGYVVYDMGTIPWENEANATMTTVASLFH